jgi:hypothetical protein
MQEMRSEHNKKRNERSRFSIPLMYYRIFNYPLKSSVGGGGGGGGMTVS